MSTLIQDPIAWFQQWFDEAQRNQLVAPETMTLATVAKDGRPSARMVLFKGMTRGAFTFYTHYESRKAQELRENPNAALVFYWEKLYRQIRIEGHAVRTSRAESDRYFASRERGSQQGAWASPQSTVISGREELDQRLQAVELRFKKGLIPRPPLWGGYRIIPGRIEFWQGREHRLHERTLFEKLGSRWKISTLSP